MVKDQSQVVLLLDAIFLFLFLIHLYNQNMYLIQKPVGRSQLHDMGAET